MGRPRTYTRAQLIQVAQDFVATFGKFPARDDFKGERRTYHEGIMGQTLPGGRVFEHEFGSWQAFRDELSAGTSKYTPGEASERISMHYATQTLGMIEVPHETGTVDGFIGDQRVEVKGALLTRASASGQSTYRWRWMIHHREVSKLVDRLVLVGVLKTGEIGCVVDIAGEQQLRDLADGRKTIDLSVSVLFGQRDSRLWPFISQVNHTLDPDNIEAYL
ncbi:hypothetical protein [Deinococcus kurensis]|uniref:hypothetical protein n=1 Tax=Deinococcus kurensis TaxID=2662757 RepID=UPI0012D36187|nr:hypothetical protein [Deinococcus kurensis]